MFAPYKQIRFSLILLFLLSASVIRTSYAVDNPLIKSVDLEIENVHVSANTSFDVAVDISDVSGLEITAFNLALLYDASLVSVTGAKLDGTLSGPDGAEMTLVYNIEEAGRIAIAAAGVEALVGSGSIVIISFESQAQDGFVALEFEEMLLNEGSPEAAGTGGSISVSSALPGDASLNGEISAFDAALVLQHAALIDTLATSASMAADVSANGEVSSFDAALILQRVASLIDCFPSEGICDIAKGHTSVAQHVQAEVAWGTVEPDGMLVHVPLVIDQVQGNIRALTVDVIASEEIDFTYDLNSRLPDGWIISHGQQADGTLRIVMAGLTPLASDTLFVLQTSEPRLSLNTTVKLNEQEGIALDALDLEETPASFALDQNYPNPFNPTTSINYALQEDIRVSLIVYDMLGREVTRLVDGFQHAGTHSVSFDAARLSSGTYIYRLEAGAFSQTRQMTLVK